MRGRQGWSLGVGTLMALIAASIGAGWALAAEIDRAGYRDLAEPICKTNVLANKRIFNGTRKLVKEGKLKAASGDFLRASRAFSKTIRQLVSLERPITDTAKLEYWFDLLRDEARIVEKIGRALRTEQRTKAESFSVELNRNSNKANNVVLSFGFDYCRIEPSRFN